MSTARIVFYVRLPPLLKRSLRDFDFRARTLRRRQVLPVDECPVRSVYEVVDIQWTVDQLCNVAKDSAGLSTQLTPHADVSVDNFICVVL